MNTTIKKLFVTPVLSDQTDYSFNTFENNNNTIFYVMDVTTK